jgi:cytochrome c oxidase assembly protein subunit 15
LHRFAVLTAIATLGLVGVGGLVTSHGAGMAVPDWPNTYGYNMFFFPVSQWVGGIFYEHTHRLAASGIGLLTFVLALWLYGRSARPVMRWGGLILLLLGTGTALAAPRRWADGSVAVLVGLTSFGASWFWPRCEPSAKWLRRCGLAALVAVVLQGVLGGLRVVLYKDAIGIFHATLAQLFFVLTCAIALFTSRWWQTPPARPPSTINYQLSTLFLLTTALILGQLTLGAAMRHQHAGLAIPDFPLAYGRLWPAMDAASVAHYNQQRMEITAVNPITAFQIGLQMIHRFLALSILGAVAFAAWSARRTLGGGNLLSRLALVWLGFILSQALLGAATIWSNKAADIATAHVLVGALVLAVGAMMSIISYREQAFDRRVAASPAAAEALPLSMLEPQTSCAAGLH